MLLAMALPTLGAQTWPAGTNVANFFFRTNQFREATSFGVGHTNIITDAGSKLNGVGFTNNFLSGYQLNIAPQTIGIPPSEAILGADGASGYLELVDSTTITGKVSFTAANGFSFTGGLLTGDGAGLTNLVIPDPLTLGQINVGTLILTNPPVLDLSASTNYAGSNVVGAVALATGATNDDLGNKISTTYYKAGSVMNLSVSTNLNGSGLFYQTNANNTTPDFWVPYSLLETNAAFAFLAPLHVSLTNAQTAVICVTNTTGVAIAVTPPASVHTQGTWNVTNMSTFTFFNYGGTFTNCIALPLW